MTETSDGYIERKVYPVSVNEAKKRLEFLKPYLVTMNEEYHNYIDTEDKLRETSKFENVQKISHLRFDLDSIEDKLRQIQLIFLDNNCVVKDMATGLIDFLAMRNNEPVWLCFKYGENELQYFHHWNSGFAGRQLIDFE